MDQREIEFIFFNHLENNRDGWKSIYLFYTVGGEAKNSVLFLLVDKTTGEINITSGYYHWGKHH